MELVIIIYIDDILLLSKDDYTLRNEKKELGNKFEMTDLGKARWFLEIKISVQQ